ncbi:MAG: isopentenyl phosphate kinase [Candidatus Bathyarchaeota archaeon]|nr:isopentenyl phosphate kinase [Candidatus Bathyarchaeota archaeon]MDH5734268.1 isopentenyl phosphate kinase [Candidatus Bathyarchaeota archaeon]
MEENVIASVSKPTILKLGGSVITIKGRPFTPNKKAIIRLAEEIARSNVNSLIIVHGGGSFGHPIAKQYEINRGYKDPSQIIGFSKTHQAMTTLNRLIINALIDQDIPAIEIQPSSCIITKSGRIQIMEQRPFTKLLRMGFVPVLYGDAVPDSETGFAILSGDQLISTLAMRLNADRIIVGADVDGICTADPKTDSSAKLICHISLSELKKLLPKIGKAKAPDVTGGMVGKIVELIPAIERKIPTIIVNATKPNNVYKALKNENVVGTIINKGGNVAKSN